MMNVAQVLSGVVANLSDWKDIPDTQMPQSIHERSSIVPRRALTPRDYEKVMLRLHRKWLSPQPRFRAWFTLASVDRHDVEASFVESGGQTALSAALNRRRVRRIWELWEDGTGYEMDGTTIEVVDNGLERYWCGHPMDWLIYYSHEHSLTIGGEWLLQMIRDGWDDWRDALYIPWAQKVFGRSQEHW